MISPCLLPRSVRRLTTVQISALSMWVSGVFSSPIIQVIQPQQGKVQSCAYWDLFFLQWPFYATRQWPDSIRSLRRRIVNSLSKGITPTQTGRKFTVRRIPNQAKRPMAHRLSAGMEHTVSVRIAGEHVQDTAGLRPG